MRVFVTGATGHVGSAIVDELLSSGHQVLGLVRSDAAAAKLTSKGAGVHRGSLEDLESLMAGAAKADATIHTAFNHDFSRYKQSCEEDRLIIGAMGSVLAGSTRPFIVTSATGLLPRSVVANEETKPEAGAAAQPRAATEEAASAVAARGVRVAIVRLPPSTHGKGDTIGFVPTLIGLARQKGAAAYVDDGANRWAAVHRLDAARLYRLVLEKRPEGGVFHAVNDEGIAVRDIVTAIAAKLGVPATSIPMSEATGYFGGAFAYFASRDMPATSTRTRAQLGWSPRELGLIADLDNYF